MFPLPFSKSKHRPLVPPRVSARRAQSSTVPLPPSGAVRAPQQQTVTGNLFTTTLDQQDFAWMGANRSDFYRYLRDHVPIISAATR